MSTSSRQPSYGDTETRRRILEAARALLEDLAADLTMTAVAKRADVSRQAVYLHFGDRQGLLLSLVEYVDASYGLDGLIAHVHMAETGAEALVRLVQVLDEAAPLIDAVAKMLESAQHRDPAMRAAWRSRMAGRQALARHVMERLAAEGRLTAGWTVDSASELCYVVTLPVAWRELTDELTWSRPEYVDAVIQLLSNTFLRSHPAPPAASLESG
jgi:AcrR family transcriptional regulator